MAPLAGTAEPGRAVEEGRDADRFSVESFVQRMPDAFVIVDRQGLVKLANPTFLDLVQAGVESAVIGQNLKRWLSRPGAGAPVVMDLVERHGSVRALRTTLEGELGASTEVEISAVGDHAGRPSFFGLVIRDAMSRAPVREAAPPQNSPIPGCAAEPLETIVKSSIETIERQHIVDALARTRGNRTLAAKSLGLSRQSLHVKLNKYRLGGR